MEDYWSKKLIDATNKDNLEDVKICVENGADINTTGYISYKIII